MKLLPVLFGLGFARVGLAAPATEPYQVITTEDGIPIVRANVVRVDTAGAIPEAVPSHSLVSHFSKLASGALGWLHVPGFAGAPVFNHETPTAVADSNGDVWGGNYGKKGHGKGRHGRHRHHRNRKPFHFYPRLSLKDGLPFIILAVSLSVVVACSFLRRTTAALEGETEAPADSALAEKGRLQQRFEDAQARAESVAPPAVSPAEGC
ncbi:Glycoside hydrolase, superfamily [Purpureocillium lavendulum]|uniref:Glycoside hydrolase, superfamily n=1 Tax=Purpureocillium lavendulum TaxID=1247861 RepID=A0AB34FY81_9HYPO|nr:Glycoside hydrolase, superfamily [Purpureocillium lavendulum]